MKWQINNIVITNNALLNGDILLLVTSFKICIPKCIDL